MSLIRIIAGPLAGTLYYFEANQAWLLCAYLLGGVSDIADGRIARRCNSASKFGARLDKVSDAIFYSAVIVSWLFALVAEQDASTITVCCAISLLANVMINPFLVYPTGLHMQALRHFGAIAIFIVCGGLLSGIYRFHFPILTEGCLIALFIYKYQNRLPSPRHQIEGRGVA